jgi:hypothetical protein
MEVTVLFLNLVLIALFLPTRKTLSALIYLQETGDAKSIATTRKRGMLANIGSTTKIAD